MDSARKLYERFRQLIHEFVKFGIVGIICVIITDGGTNGLQLTFHIGWLTANVIATIVATAVAFVASRYWTFRHRQRTSVRREGPLFFLFNGIALLIQLACLGFTTHLLGLSSKLPANVAILVGIALATSFRFWSYTKWVWIDSRQGPPVWHALEPVLAPASGARLPAAKPESHVEPRP
jgi:putative flippase GtrA